jgi:hypothetical protein
MPAPTDERQALEREREELPGQIAADQRTGRDPSREQDVSSDVGVADPADAETDGGDSGARLAGN